MADCGCRLPEPLHAVFDTAARSGIPDTAVHRAAHQAILRSFASSARPPSPAELADTVGADQEQRAGVLAELARNDVTGLDTTGAIRLADPFSTQPTAHRVRISGGATPWAMCAVDALGIPAMLRTDAVIESADPRTGAAVMVEAAARARAGDTYPARWQPRHAVVLAGARPVTGPAASVCCETVNFFADREGAEEWSRRNPEVTYTVLDQEQAVRLGIRTFGTLLGTP
ncbi:alkylmercury lyase family protein [Lipingzhangella sp. LS1_29]|uniref:Alkylmercury lyase family protein n=1 Tax=Lipingzhangella rawalii TaxID=2055835 RepID=A0ABU2H4L9_9ACTN|nr:alkylmercury lyase family protein [Lipingzhangella rawalii]MDS1270252.1 alkylmercury lyase family protein [Lipingzhangella rawalii]